MDNDGPADWAELVSRGELGGGVTKAVKIKKGLGVSRKLTFTFKGSSKPIIDPYETLLENMYRIVSETDANNSRRAFVDLLIGEPRSMEGPGFKKALE